MQLKKCDYCCEKKVHILRRTEYLHFGFDTKKTNICIDCYNDDQEEFPSNAGADHFIRAFNALCQTIKNLSIDSAVKGVRHDGAVYYFDAVRHALGLYLDEKANNDRIDALTKIFTGQVGGFFGGFVNHMEK